MGLYPIRSIPDEEIKHADSYEIWQLKLTDKNINIMYKGMDYLRKHDLTVDFSKYERVYVAPMEAGKTLEDLYTQFNVFKPDDFRGRSMSTSDIVILYDKDEATPYYCDIIGFTDVSEFVTLKDIFRESEIADAVEEKKPSIRLRLKEAQRRLKEKPEEQQECTKGQEKLYLLMQAFGDLRGDANVFSMNLTERMDDFSQEHLVSIEVEHEEQEHGILRYAFMLGYHAAHEIICEEDSPGAFLRISSKVWKTERELGFSSNLPERWM